MKAVIAWAIYLLLYVLSFPLNWIKQWEMSQVSTQPV